MRKDYCVRVLTETNGLGVQEKVLDAVCSSLRPYQVEIHPLKPCLNFKGWGEMEILVKNVKEADREKLMRRLADKWYSEITDSNWARIYCDKIHAIRFTEAA